ncbi:uncharacterized protein EAF01_006995 [Botrytis porri]|uniref:uncharacterized protein n=1 Tax=Botrytis porri TaxID=87229 RepID=UPI0019012BD4|nr:uncharacterized protein EAF01_006995 [Botrytis porri]KAF7901696.1 hypothetical protein EAF01_006995 [Botrytis porri]
MEISEMGVASMVATLLIPPMPSISSDSLIPQSIPILQTSPTPSIPSTPPRSEISPATPTPQILSTSSIPPTPSTELDADHSWGFDSGTGKAPSIIISERKNLYPHDLFSDDLYSDDMKWTSLGSSPKSRANARSAHSNKSTDVKSNHPDELCFMSAYHSTPPDSYLGRSSSFSSLYDMQSACAVSIENLLGLYGILLYQLLWGNKKHGRVSFSQHPAYFDTDHPDTFSSFVDVLNFDVERTSPLPLDRKPAFILLLQVTKQPPSLRYPEAVPDWYRIDHLLFLGYREHLWAIYSPADANACMSYALKIWSRVHHHEPGLLS